MEVMKKLIVLFVLLFINTSLFGQYKTKFYNKQEVHLRYLSSEHKKMLRKEKVNYGAYKMTFNKEYNYRRKEYFEFINEYEDDIELGYYGMLVDKGYVELKNRQLYKKIICYSTELDEKVSVYVHKDYDEIIIYTHDRVYKYTYDVSYGG